MQTAMSAAALLLILSTSGVHGSTFFSKAHGQAQAHAARTSGVCDPENEVCHGCESICSQYADDDKLLLSTKCLAECQVDVYNCMEGTLPADEPTQEAPCIKEKLLERIKSDGDLVLKIVYDVPPGFKEFDQLYDEDGIIDSRDVQVAFDLLDGGAAPDGTVIPTSKVQVVWETLREADQDGDGIITEAEFEVYEMGTKFEKSHPTPEQKELGLLEVTKPPHSTGAKKAQKHGQHKPNKSGKKLAYFQHLLRLGLRVWRAEEKQPHPITKLAEKIGTYMAKNPKKQEKK